MTRGRARAGTAAPRAKPRMGLALAGGGPFGAIYEIGALTPEVFMRPALREYRVTA